MLIDTDFELCKKFIIQQKRNRFLSSCSK